MYVSQLDLENFRSLESFSISFQPGLNLIVGENNVGKTHVIDALRLVLGQGSGPRDIYARKTDLRHDANGDVVADSFKITLTISDIKGKQTGPLVKLMVPKLGDDIAKLTFEYRKVSGKDRHAVRVWGGDNDTALVESEVLDLLQCVFLPALRNPETDLRPGRASRVAVLLEAISDDKNQEDVVETLKKANDQIQALPLVKTATDRINQNLKDISGTVLAQQSDIVFSDPSFRKVAQSVKSRVGTDGLFEVEENGLGYNNLLFTAAVLAELAHSTQDEDNGPVFAALLLEEPEAHLHPQLQAPLVRYLEQQSEKDGIQVIATTHSAVIASSVGIDRSIVIHRDTSAKPASVIAKPLCKCGLDDNDLALLERYLDVTRSCLLLARGVILVEGISEMLLFPLFAKKIGYDLKDHAVSLVCVDGLSFKPFYTLFKANNLRVPCAVVTDADPRSDDEEQGARAKGVEADMDGLCKAFIAPRTFEYALAQCGNWSQMLAKYVMLHPRKGADLQAAVSNAVDADAKASEILKAISPADKAPMAQYLLQDWEKDSNGLVVPDYIQEAIRFACRA